MAAEYALKALLDPNSIYVVGSAGTQAMPKEILPFIQARLLEKGANPSKHLPRRLTQQILESADVPVAMGLDHRDFVREHYRRDVRLYNEICFERPDPVLDIGEAIPNWYLRPQTAVDYALSVVDYLWETMPTFLAHLRTHPQGDGRFTKQT